jgi:hypothetical protein
MEVKDVAMEHLISDSKEQVLLYKDYQEQM